MKHKFYDVIVAWAAGEPIQVRYHSDSHIWIDYLVNNPNSPNFDAENIEWRVKPKPTVIKYRIALMKLEALQPALQPNYYLVTSNEHMKWGKPEHEDNFVKWVTDWQEMEAEIEE